MTANTSHVRSFAAPPSADDIAAGRAGAAGDPPARRISTTWAWRSRTCPTTPRSMNSASSPAWDLTGLYRGTPLTQRSVDDMARQPDLIFLYRQPILLEWIETGEDLYPAGAQRRGPRDRASFRLQRCRHRDDRTARWTRRAAASPANGARLPVWLPPAAITLPSPVSPLSTTSVPSRSNPTSVSAAVPRNEERSGAANARAAPITRPCRCACRPPP